MSPTITNISSKAGPPSTASLWPRNLRQTRNQQVLLAQSKILGVENTSKMGDKAFLRPLQGPQMMKQYFPSKFAFQSFHIDEYYQMQSERFQNRQIHPGIIRFEEMVGGNLGTGQGYQGLGSSQYNNQLSQQLSSSSYRQELKSYLKRKEVSGELYRSQKLLDLKEYLELFESMHEPYFNKVENDNQEDLNEQTDFQKTLQSSVRLSPPLPEQSEMMSNIRESISRDDWDSFIHDLETTTESETEERFMIERKWRMVMKKNSQSKISSSEQDESPESESQSETEAPVYVAENEEEKKESVLTSASSSAEVESKELSSETKTQRVSLFADDDLDEEEPSDLCMRKAMFHGSRSFLEKKKASSDSDMNNENNMIMEKIEGTVTADAKENNSDINSDSKENLNDASAVTIETVTPVASTKKSSSAVSRKSKTSKSSSEKSPGNNTTQPEWLSLLSNTSRRRALTAAALNKSNNLNKSIASKQPQTQTHLLNYNKNNNLTSGTGGANGNYRFIDPMFRRRRLKWLQRRVCGRHKDKEVKYSAFWLTHPDDMPSFPDNKGSVTVKWPHRNF